MRPANVNFGKIEGRFLAVIGDGPDLGEEPDFIPEQGTIEFVAAVPYLLDPTADPSPVAIRTTTISGILDDEGYLCTVAPNGTAGARGLWLIATDDADLSVENWTWSATYKFAPVNGTNAQIPSHSFAVPAGSVQDLSTLARVPSSPGYGLPQAEAAVIRAEAAAVSAADDAALAEAAAARAELVAGATDAGVASLLSTTGTATRTELDSRLATKADKSVVDAATASNNADTIVKRNSAGNFSVSDPTSPTHAATKGYVDTQTASLDSTKADKSAVETSLAFKADLDNGKVPVAQLPTDSLVTDANVAAQINGAQTGPAIDARINTQVTPIVEPVVADYIASQPAVVDAAAAAVDANPKITSLEAKNVSQDTAIADAQHYMGALPLNTNLINLPAKVSTYAVASTSASQIVPALPAGFANIGALEVLHASTTGGGYRLFRFTTIGGSTRGVHEIELQAGVFTAWRRTDYHEPPVAGPRTVPNGTNIDTLIRSGGAYDGDWTTFTDIATNGITGIPAGETSLFNLRVRGGTGFQEIEFYKGGLYWRPIINAATNAFGPWVRLDQPQTAPTTTEYALEREVRTARAKQRVGGKIGTSGLPAFALRFDDWADDMQNTVLPELRSRNLCAGWAATVAYVENPQQGLPSTWPTVGEWVRDGVELMGHSWTHVNASGDANIRHEVIESADYIESMVPAAAIDTWTMPGTSAGANTYDGFGIGDKLENYYTKPAGRMILQRYPVVGGAITGRFLPLVGAPSIGRVHLTIDTLTAASVIADMEKARDAGVGYQLMCHPIHIGKTDKITLADFQAILDWLAAERDAGRIEVLTPRGIAYADKSSTEWMSLVPGVDQWTGWNNRTGWTESGGVLTTTTGGVMVRAINMTNYGNFRGGIVEIVARVRTPAGAVVQTGITGGAERSVDHTLPASTEWKMVRTVATIPNNLADSASLVASIGRVSGGQVDIDFMAVRPV